MQLAERDSGCPDGSVDKRLKPDGSVDKRLKKECLVASDPAQFVRRFEKGVVIRH